MNTMSCPTSDMLAAYVLGKVSEADLIGISSHIEACSVCQSHLETLDGLGDTVITCLRRSIPEKLDPDDSLLDELLSRVELIRSESGSGFHDRVREAILPQEIAQYRLLEKLGQGGMGAVYRAFHTKLKRTVAVKLLPAYSQRSPQAVIRFHREMEAVGRLDHPNIVRAHDAGEADGQSFLVMEFVEGSNLSSLVRSGGPLEIADACNIVQQAAIGLQHAHEHGLVHRDVKPSNLMLTTAGTVKVLDLGLARLQVEVSGDGEVTASGHIMGSPDYMAPEQGTNPREADARADVYSLGCTLYFLLAERPPFGDRRHMSFLEKVMAHAKEEVTPIQQLRPDVPGQLAVLLDKMLAKSPTNRCSTATEVAHLLAPFATGSNLAGLLKSRADKAATTPTPLNRLSPGTPNSPPKTPDESPISVAMSYRKAWLTCLGLAPLVLVALWYGGSILTRDSADTMQREGHSQTSAEAAPSGQKQDADEQNARIVSTYLKRATVPESVRTTMLTVVRQHPGETRWSGRVGTTLFGIAAKRLPKEQVGQRAVPAMLELTHMWAVHELLTAKSLLDRYAALGLTDATTLRQAVVEAAGKLQVSGKANTVTHQATTEGNLAISYAMADEAALTAQLLQPDEIEKVRIAYRDVMHRQARDLMQRSNWADALLLWQHLHKRQLVSQQLYLDAAWCFNQLNQAPDMIRVLTEAIDTFGKNAGSEFLEKAGDMALAIETDQAQALAERAYRLASERLQEGLSSGYEQTTNAGPSH